MENEGIRKIAKAARENGDLRTSLAVMRTIEAEKRTHLAELRTGIGILTIPMSLLTILIATSEYYMVDQVLPLIVALVFGIIGLAIVGSYLVGDALRNLRKDDWLIEKSSDDTEDLLKNYENNGSK